MMLTSLGEHFMQLFWTTESCFTQLCRAW